MREGVVDVFENDWNLFFHIFVYRMRVVFGLDSLFSLKLFLTDPAIIETIHSHSFIPPPTAPSISPYKTRN